MAYNQSTYRAVSSRLKQTNRHRLLRLSSKLFCPTCQRMEVVTDFFSGSDVAVLSCKHRRPVFFRQPEEIAAYEAARREHQTRREVVGKNSPTAGGTVHCYVEDVSGERHAQ